MLEAREISLRLGGRPALSAASLSLRPGEVLALVGPNGAGKSTLLSCLSGALRPERGAALIDGAPVAALDPAALALRRAVLEQSPASAAAFAVTELVGLAIPIGIPPKEAAEIAADAVEALGLSALAERRLAALSGGERHRAHMARALAQLEAGRRLGFGRWLLLDEPTASLDPRHQASVLRAARRAARAGAGVLAVLHDLTLAAHLADRIALLKNGRVLAVAPPAEALTPERLSEVYEMPMRVSAAAAGALTVTPLYHQA